MTKITLKCPQLPDTGVSQLRGAAQSGADTLCHLVVSGRSECSLGSLRGGLSPLEGEGEHTATGPLMLSSGAWGEELLFTEAEWIDALPGVVEKMTEFLRPYRVAVYTDRGSYGEGWGSGSYVRIEGKVFIVTNHHVAAAREQQQILTHQFNGREDVRRIGGNHVAYPAPLDLALLPVDMAAWSDPTNASKAIESTQIALFHDPALTELLTFTGFAGQRVKFYFGTLFAEATCYTAREIELPHDDRFSSRFHFGMDYRPDLASCVIGNNDLPLPPGLSGSTVWDTGFVAAKIAGIQWTPEMAKVTGVIWGWPSSHACVVATRAEYLRGFLLEALSHLGISGAA